MIPSNVDYLEPDVEVEQYATKTYKLNLNSKRVNGWVDGLEAVEQAIYKILNTERYTNLIYSWNYGSELISLIGETKTAIYPELKKRITEALLQDDRVLSVDSFTFATDRKAVSVTFSVCTSEGELEIRKVVNI